MHSYLSSYWLSGVLLLAGLTNACLASETTAAPADGNLQTLQTAVSDGPYLSHQDAKILKAQWVCAGKVIEQQQDVTKAVEPHCGYNKAIRVHNAVASGWQFQTKRWAAISDIHGQYDLMIRLLQAANIIDAERQWQFGANQLVIVGDVMDRGNKVTEALWFLYDLQQQAARAGGAVHLLPGNHETMVLRGDLRYVHPDYEQVADKLHTTLPALYGEHSVLGAWLRQLPLFVRINDTLFVHGGISAELAALLADQQTDNRADKLALQQAFQHSWGRSKTELAQQPQQQLLQGSAGPLWYRGYFSKDNPVDRSVLQQQLKRFGAEQIVVGHTSMDDVYSHHGGLVYSVDSSIKKGKSGAVLHYIDGRYLRSGLDGQLTPVTPAPAKEND
jgi:diadenosine tetraphosphatase ApaH/serine/threonine PP2A family protein phosphatase